MLACHKDPDPRATPQEFTNYMLFHAPGFNSSDGACEPLPEDEFWNSVTSLYAQDLKVGPHSKEGHEDLYKLFRERHAARSLQTARERLRPTHNAAAEALAGAWQCGHMDR